MKKKKRNEETSSAFLAYKNIHVCVELLVKNKKECFCNLDGS